MDKKKWLSLIVLLLLIVPSQLILAQQGRQMAPDITLRDINREIVHLQSLRGRYVLIDFWTAASVNAMRYQNLNQLRNKYQNQGFVDGMGFEIFSVSLDTDPNVWFDASRQLNVTWVNASDMRGRNSAIAQMFGVVEIPTSFLIDPQGMIVGKDYAPAEIDQLLASLQAQSNNTPSFTGGSGVSDRVFRVELGLFNQDQLRFHDFTPITHLGKLEKVPVQNNTAVVAMLGPYDEEGQAQHVLDAVLAAGYERARMLIDLKNRKQPGEVVIGGADVFAPPSPSVADGYNAPPPAPVYTPVPAPSNNYGEFESNITYNEFETPAPRIENNNNYYQPGQAVVTTPVPPSTTGTYSYDTPITTYPPAASPSYSTTTYPSATPSNQGGTGYPPSMVITAPPPSTASTYAPPGHQMTTYPTDGASTIEHIGTTGGVNASQEYQYVTEAPVTQTTNHYQSNPQPASSFVYSTPPPAGTMEEEFIPEIEIAYEQADESGDNFNNRNNASYSSSPNVALEPAPVYPSDDRGSVQVPDVRTDRYNVEATVPPSVPQQSQATPPPVDNCRIPIYYRDGMPVYEDKTVGQVKVYQQPPPPGELINTAPNTGSYQEDVTPTGTFPWEGQGQGQAMNQYPSQANTYQAPAMTDYPWQGQGQGQAMNQYPSQANTYMPTATTPASNDVISTNRDALPVGIGTQSYTKDQPAMGGNPIEWGTQTPDIETIEEEPYIGTRPNEYERQLEQGQWQGNDSYNYNDQPYNNDTFDYPADDGADFSNEGGFDEIPNTVKGQKYYQKRIAKKRKKLERKMRRNGGI